VARMECCEVGLASFFGQPSTRHSAASRTDPTRRYKPVRPCPITTSFAKRPSSMRYPPLAADLSLPRILKTDVRHREVIGEAGMRRRGLRDRIRPLGRSPIPS
jgi:hypothetical protein